VDRRAHWPDVRAAYGTLRNFVEGAYGVVKAPQFGGIEDARRRRARGQAAANVLLAFMVAGSNMRRIDQFVADKAAGTLGSYAGPGKSRRRPRPPDDVDTATWIPPFDQSGRSAHRFIFDGQLPLKRACSHTFRARSSASSGCSEQVHALVFHLKHLQRAHLRQAEAKGRRSQ